MTAQNKAAVNVYVHEHSVTEQPRDGVDYAPIRHAYSHPDCIIRIWRGGMVSIAGKRDAIRHTLLTALVAAGISPSALRDHKAGKKRVAASEIDMTETEYEGTVAKIREVEAQRDMLALDNPDHKTEYIRRQLRAYNSQLSRLRKKAREYETRASQLSLL